MARFCAVLALAASQMACVLAAKHLIKVGPGLNFTPSETTASPGDFLVFKFIGGHHTVTQGSLTEPCQPLSDTSFYSGEVTPNSTESKFVVQVNDSNPIFFYCSTETHCMRGMAGVVNPGDMTLSTYIDNAAKTNGSAPAPSGGVAGGVFAVYSSNGSGHHGHHSGSDHCNSTGPSSQTVNAAMHQATAAFSGSLLAAIGAVAFAAL